MPRNPVQACIYCRARAVRWCDLILGFTDPDGDGLFSFDDGSEFLRCDAPLCEAHAVFQHNLHFSGAWPAGGNESVDYCCGHEDVELDRWRAMSEEEARGIRFRHQCIASGPLRLLKPAAITA